MWTTRFITLVHSLHIVVGLVNLSVNKSADMSTSQYSDKWLADEAVDGDVSQDVEDNSCAVTLYGYTPEAWWRVGLGDVYVVNSVRIYNRKESPYVTHKLSGFSLYVSGTSNWLTGVLCYLDNNGVQGLPVPSDVLTVPCNATGRYVTLYKRRVGNTCNDPDQPQYCTQLELCEVQVFGCNDGTYGASCENNCSGNCLNGETCNKVHGGCDNGCTAGYSGFRCDKDRDITSSANNSNNTAIILIVTNVLTVIGLVTSVFLLCRHVRKTTNNSPGQQTQQDSPASPVLPVNRSVRGTAYQPGTGDGSTGNPENRTYEGLQLNSTVTNTYDVLQTERNATYTNTQLI